jgi:hypothetical protein
MKQEIRNAAAILGKKGGKARARNLSVTEKSESARKAIAARWEKAHAHSAACQYAKTGRLTPGCPGCLWEARKFVANERGRR